MRIKSWERESTGSKIFDVVNVSIMVILMVIFVYPVLNVIAISLSDYLSTVRGEVTFYPVGLTFDAYTYVLSDRSIGRAYLNTVFYAASSTLIMLFVTSMIAYSLSRRNYVFAKFTTIYLTITMFFSGGLVPTYLIMRQLHLIDTIWLMIIPGTVSAYNCFVFRTFFKTIPEELIDAAKIEGAGEFRILYQIVVPLSKSLIATFSLFTIVGVWNNWFSALIYLNSQEKYPLQLILRNYLFVMDNNQMQQTAGLATGANPLSDGRIDAKSIRMAMIAITMFPIMMVYPFFQKYFVKGVMIGAVKG